MSAAALLTRASTFFACGDCDSGACARAAAILAASEPLNENATIAASVSAVLLDMSYVASMVSSSQSAPLLQLEIVSDGCTPEGLAHAACVDIVGPTSARSIRANTYRHRYSFRPYV